MEPKATRKTTNAGGRLRNYLKVVRQAGDEGSTPAAQSVHQRKGTRDSTTRMREYLRIERGVTA